MFRKEKRLFMLFAALMAFVVAISNYLVQFPIKYYGLNDLLTYGALSYPVAFLITDLSNKYYGKKVAKQIVYLGFILGIFLTFYFSTNYQDLISVRIAIGSGIAFLTAQLIDVQIFHLLRKKKMVCGTINLITGRLNNRYFFIFFNIFLWNRC